MELLVGLIVVAAVIAIAYMFWQRGRVKQIEGKARLYNRYMDLRDPVVRGEPVVNGPGYDQRADVIVTELGPAFDPRVSAWKRLDLIDPKLRAFVTSGINPAIEDPMDLEIFAERILSLECAGFRGITPPEWFEAAKEFVADAATVRSLPPPMGKSMDSAEAFEEATAVARRYFSAFGSKSWDRERGIAVD